MSKVIITHPRSGIEKQIDSTIYGSFKSAIFQSLKGSKGKTFTELTKDVEKIIQQKMPAFKGSVPWYTISVRLDLETKGVIGTFTEKGKKMCKL